MSAHLHLRTATAADHEQIDATYGAFDLSDPASYARFLTAHARALPAVEAALAGIPDLPRLRPRTALLHADLEALGLSMPSPLPLAAPTDSAAAFGMAYVIEGSRLGGGMLARQVPAGLPSAYLSAVHLPGEWRAFGQALDTAAMDEDWLKRAAASANQTFNLYASAAA
jgi:heme oxygenase